ncbi:Ribokinase [Lamellibrachia satsuma]|nr:Ribokinase [Lamellibrachia satsuma]
MDVVVVGSCMMDFISYTPRLPATGETVQGHKFTVGFGGKGANQCIVAARLGAKTAMIAQVGNDKFGPGYIQNFKDNGVNTEHVGIKDEASTGVATITVDNSGKNTIVIVSGANLLLNEASISRAESVIKAAKVMICQLEISPKVTLEALKLAKNME